MIFSGPEILLSIFQPFQIFSEAVGTLLTVNKLMTLESKIFLFDEHSLSDHWCVIVVWEKQ